MEEKRESLRRGDAGAQGAVVALGAAVSAGAVGAPRASDAPAKPSTSKPSAFAQYRALLGKDVRQELRTREMLTSMVVYSLLVLTVYGAALAQVGDKLQVVSFSGGLLWALIVFTSLLGLNRSFSHETESGCLEGILLAPVDARSCSWPRRLRICCSCSPVELVTVPLFFVFFLSGAPLSATAPMIVLPLLVGTVGVAGVGTLLSTMAIDTRGKDVLLAILFIPVAFPLLYACVSATGVALAGVEGTFATFWRSLALAGTYDVVMIAAAWGLYEFVLDS